MSERYLRLDRKRIQIDKTWYHIYSAKDYNFTLPTVIAWAKAHNKPFVVEEFGFEEGPQGTACPMFPPASFKVPMDDGCRANAFAQVYNGINALDNHAGAIFWNLANLPATGEFGVWPSVNPLVWSMIQKYSQVYTTGSPPAS